MTNSEISTEEKIIQAANSIFLLFGYHGTKLQQIATKVGVNKAAIHYYFRSKERLYFKVVKNVLDLILNTEFGIISDRKGFEKPAWFLITELYNNRNLFENALRELYQDDWDKKIGEIEKWLEFSTNERSIPLDG
jgi:AcrR family transcriptional regulator